MKENKKLKTLRIICLKNNNKWKDDVAVLKIIQFINPQTKVFDKYLEIYPEEKEAISTISLMIEEVEKVIVDIRDKYEFNYVKKFLKMLSGLTNINDVTRSIDKIILEDPILKEIDKALCSDEEFEITNVTYDISNAINKKNTQDKKKKTKKDEYEQIEMDFNKTNDEGQKDDEN